ncbi:MAG: class I SAM-dependent methyltransferase [Ilumatobacteraceae bacterium]
MPDAIFEDPRLARDYDSLDSDRRDLDLYVAILDESDATHVLDVGWGTGTLACRLAARGVSVVAVDPAAASLEVARCKPHADRVRWIHGDATSLPPLSLDAAVMTGNVAQVFVTDYEWLATLSGIHRAVRLGSHLVFDSRVPARRAWRWTPELTYTAVEVIDIGIVESWQELLDVDGALVTFRSMVRFQGDALLLESRSTLRFRDRDELEASLSATGYDIDDVRDAPDRPGLEHVFIATQR